MDKNTLIATCDRELRLLRSEFGMTQDDMARELGISKKTLVGIEKGRSSLGWTGSAALCLLFGDSQTLRRELEGDPADMAAGLREHRPPERDGGIKKAPAEHLETAEAALSADTPDAGASSPLWRYVGAPFGIRAEQNLISEHYRLTDAGGRRLFASFDYAEIEAEAERLCREKKRGGDTDDEKRDPEELGD